MSAQFHLADLFEIVVRSVPDRVAILDRGVPTTYAVLDKRINQLATGLRAHGVKAGDTLGLYLTNRPQYIEFYMAAHKIGAVPFNVNYRYGPEELRYLFNNADTAVLVHGQEYSPMVSNLRNDIETLKLTISIPDDSEADFQAAGSVDYAEVLQGDGTPPDHPRDPDGDLMLLYTGGTTGMPKGVMWTSKGFFFGCLGGGGYYHPDGVIKKPEDIAVRATEGTEISLYALAPLMHGAALWSVFTALTVGHTVVMDAMPGFDTERIWDRVVSDKVSMIQIVGDAMAIPLLDTLKANPGRWALDHMIAVGSGGAMFSGYLKDAFKALLPQIYIADGLGSSEGGVSGMGQSTENGVLSLKVGPTQNVIVDDRFAEAGEVGLLAKSGYVPLGYYNDPVKTAEVFRQVNGQTWVTSGDQARLEADGSITVFGRGNTCINTGGEKVFPEEVEGALRTHPAVLDAVVVGLPDPRWGQKVTAVVSRRDGYEMPTFDALRDHCRSLLAGYKLPREMVVVDTVARSPAGKQDYRWAKRTAEEALAC